MAKQSSRAVAQHTSSTAKQSSRRGNQYQSQAVVYIHADPIKPCPYRPCPCPHFKPCLGTHLLLQGLPLLIGSFGTITVLLFGRPEAEAIRFWNLLAGQVLSIAVRGGARRPRAPIAVTAWLRAHGHHQGMPFTHVVISHVAPPATNYYWSNNQNRFHCSGSRSCF